MANYKAEATAQYTAESLALRTGLPAVVDLSGADPIIKLGAVAATTNVGVSIRIKDQRAGDAAGWKALPGFGSVDQPVYTGTTFQIYYEIGAGGAGSFFFGFANLLQTVGDLVRRGARVELYSITNGNPAIVDGVGAALVSAFEGNLYWPLQGRV